LAWLTSVSVDSGNQGNTPGLWNFQIYTIRATEIVHSLIFFAVKMRRCTDIRRVAFESATFFSDSPAAAAAKKRKLLVFFSLYVQTTSFTQDSGISSEIRRILYRKKLFV